MSSNQARPEFSIITVTLNSAKTLPRCIKSLQAQSFTNFEYIIVDGVSKDSTLRIIDNHRDLVTTLISEPDSGLYDAMNKAIKLARGRFVGILNSDDEYLPETLSVVSEHFHNNPDTEVVYGELFMGEGMSEILDVPLNEISNRMIPHPTVFVSLESYRKYGDFNTSYKVSADYELVLRLRKEGVRIFKLDTPLAVMHPGGYSARHRYRSIIETIFLHLKYREEGLLSILLRESRYLLAAVLKRQ